MTDDRFIQITQIILEVCDESVSDSDYEDGFNDGVNTLISYLNSSQNATAYLVFQLAQIYFRYHDPVMGWNIINPVIQAFEKKGLTKEEFNTYVAQVTKDLLPSQRDYLKKARDHAKINQKILDERNAEKINLEQNLKEDT